MDQTKTYKQTSKILLQVYLGYYTSAVFLWTAFLCIFSLIRSLEEEKREEQSLTCPQCANEFCYSPVSVSRIFSEAVRESQMLHKQVRTSTPRVVCASPLLAAANRQSRGRD